MNVVVWAVLAIILCLLGIWYFAHRLRAEFEDEDESDWRMTNKLKSVIGIIGMIGWILGIIFAVVYRLLK
jgi:hypothetical protein